MGFLGIGSWEILLILVLALIIWGPGKLPEIARTLGKTVRALKKASFDLTTAVTKEIEATENKQPASQPRESPATKAEKTPPNPGKAIEPQKNSQPHHQEEQ